jgi:hypothetical protein
LNIGLALRPNGRHGRVPQITTNFGRTERRCLRSLDKALATLSMSGVVRDGSRALADAPFVVQKSYFGRERFEGTEVRKGLKMHFAGWSQPLESYMAALENAGLAITSLREPVPDTADKGSHMERWKKIPLFLWLKAIPLPI